MDEQVSEEACVICSSWPAAERAMRRKEHFSSGWIELPLEDVCSGCCLAFWRGISISVDSAEEGRAFRQAVRDERRRGSMRPAREILEELRRKKH